MEDVYSRIDAILSEKGWSRRQLAIKAGIKPGTLSAAFARKSKKMSSEILHAIAAVLNVSSEYLTSGKTFETFTSICKQAEVTPEQAFQDIGADMKVLDDWREKEVLPSEDILKKIAADFSDNDPFFYEEFMYWLIGRMPDRQGKTIPMLASKKYGLVAFASEQERDFVMYEERLLANFGKLNTPGQKKAVEDVELLTKVPEYQKGDDDAQT